MRLLILNYEYPPLGGGSSPMTASLCAELARLGVEIDVVTMAFGDLPRVEQVDGVRIHRVKGIRSARYICYTHELLTYILAGARKAFSLAKSHRYDLVHAHFVVPGGAVAYWLNRKLGLPYVITAHGSDVPGYNPDRFLRIHRWIAPAWRKIISRAEAVVSPSETLAVLIRKASSRLPSISLIPNAIDSDWNLPAVKSKKILVVSRLFERKGVQYLLSALQKKRTGYEVHIVGDGPFRKNLEKMVSTVADPVTFHGWLDNRSESLGRLYRESLLFAFLSDAENFPMCLLEAMVSRNAIIATDIPGCREVLGEAAFYVPPQDSTAIGRALDELTIDRSKAEVLGSKARQRAEALFSWSVVGKQYYDLFAEVIGESASIEQSAENRLVATRS